MFVESNRILFSLHFFRLKKPASLGSSCKCSVFPEECLPVQVFPCGGPPCPALHLPAPPVLMSVTPPSPFFISSDSHYSSATITSAGSLVSAPSSINSARNHYIYSNLHICLRVVPTLQLLSLFTRSTDLKTVNIQIIVISSGMDSNIPQVNHKSACYFLAWELFCPYNSLVTLCCGFPFPTPYFLSNSDLTCSRI